MHPFLAAVLMAALAPGVGAVVPGPRTAAQEPFVLTLVDDLGRPLDGVAVQLGVGFRTPGGSSWFGFRKCVADAAGLVRFNRPTRWSEGGTLDVQVLDERLTGAEFDHPAVAWEPDIRAATVVVRRPGWIVGRVTTLSPDDEVRVVVSRFDEGFGELLERDTSGRFRIGPIAAGAHELRFRYGLADVDTTFVVPPDGDSAITLVDFGRGGWVRGRAVDHLGAPLGSGRFSWYAPGGLDLSVIDGVDTSIAEDGSFRVGPLGPGRTPVVVFARGSEVATAIEWVNVPERGEVCVDLAPLEPPAKLRGVLRHRGVPVAERGVSAAPWNDMWSRVDVSTDSEGRYELEVPRAGWYLLASGNTHLGEVWIGGAPTVRDLEVPDTRLELVAPEGAEADKPLWFDLWTDSPGTYGPLFTGVGSEARSVFGLAPGHYRVSARQARTVLARTWVTVPPTGEVATAFGAVARGELEVRGFDPHGVELEGVACDLRDERGATLVYWEELSAGRYDLRAVRYAEPKLAGFACVEVRAGARTEAHVALAAAASLDVTGWWNGALVAPSVMLVHDRGHLVDGRGLRWIVGPGTARLAHLPPGDYVLLAEVPGAAPVQREVTLLPGARGEVEVVFR